jgi:hypothetical protein
MWTYIIYKIPIFFDCEQIWFKSVWDPEKIVFTTQLLLVLLFINRLVELVFQKNNIKDLRRKNTMKCVVFHDKVQISDSKASYPETVFLCIW